MTRGKSIAGSLVALFRNYDVVTYAEIDRRVSQIVVIGQIDRQIVEGWVDDLKAVALHTPMSNFQFVRDELDRIYSLLAQGWTVEAVNHYMDGVKRRYA